MSVLDRMHFGMMALVHENLYSLFRNPYEVLDAAGLKPGHKVLEVGCGPGFFSIPAARIVGEKGTVHALDMSPLAIERGQQKIEKEGVTNIKTILADAAQTGLPDGSFDLIFVFGFTHHVGGTGDIFAELHRLLKPSGVLSVEGRLVPPNRLFRRRSREGRVVQYGKIA